MVRRQLHDNAVTFRHSSHIPLPQHQATLQNQKCSDGARQIAPSPRGKVKYIKVSDEVTSSSFVTTAPSLACNSIIPSKMEVKVRKPVDIILQHSSISRRPNQCLALDCEMVGVGPKNVSVLARVSIVDTDGNCIFDSFVKIQERVTDYRTELSGIRREDLQSKDALPFGEVRLKVCRILNGCILVGHGLRNDLKILNLSKYAYSIRDTTEYIPFMKQWWDGTYRPRRLRDIFWDNFGLVIQSGEHSSVEDAAAAMSLYNFVKEEWESSCASCDKGFNWSYIDVQQNYYRAFEQRFR